MKKIYLNNKKITKWFLWLILIILWNYIYPEATPFQDVIVAVVISLIFIFFEKLDS